MCLLASYDNSSIERVEEFKYLETTVTDQNSIQEEIKNRLRVFENRGLRGDFVHKRKS
jgi:hypothetical protein